MEDVDELVWLLGAATEGCPSLDRKIALAVIYPGAYVIGGLGAPNSVGRIDGDPRWHKVHVPSFTTSLDAAEQLIPEGWCWSAGRQNVSNYEGPMAFAWKPSIREAVVARAANPAIALCIACLRARAVVTATVP